MTKMYKLLGEHGEPLNGGNEKWQWHLPKGKCPGKWMPALEGEISAYGNGYHLSDASHIVCWLSGNVAHIYEAEGRGDEDRQSDKTAYRQARLLRFVGTLDERKMRLFACDCAERVLHRFEEKHPDDKRPREAIAVARRYAKGDATAEELAAAWDAAWDAIWGATWVAGMAVARAAAWAADGDAAGAADGAAAWAAAGAADGAAERDWQGERLLWYVEKVSDDDGN